MILFSLLISTVLGLGAPNSTRASICVGRFELTVERTKKVFCWDDKSHAHLSQECSSNRNCGAYKLLALADPRMHKVEPGELRGGRNLGSVLCPLVQGTEQMGYLKDGSQISVCVAADQSMITCSGLANRSRGPSNSEPDHS